MAWRLLSAFVGLTLLEVPKAVSATGTLSWSIEKRTIPQNDQPGALVERSAGTVGTNVFDAKAYAGSDSYYVNLTLGTPPQPLTLLLDTGSADLTVNAPNAAPCQQGNCPGGTFDANASSTFKLVAPGALNAQYAGGAYAKGDYASDVLGIGNIQVSGVQFGLASDVYAPVGKPPNLVGLQLDVTEGTQSKYPNLPDVLEQAGVINSRLYSLWLNQQDATGSLLFGGIDTSAYTGKLYTFDMIPYGDGGGQPIVVQKPFVNLTGVSITSDAYSGSAPDFWAPAFLDSGNSGLNTVPMSIYNMILNALPGAVDSNTQQVACKHMNDNTTVSFTFSDFTVPIPIGSFIRQFFYTQNGTAGILNGEPVCFLTVHTNGQSGFVTLGDPVLRSLFTVFDYDRGEISLAVGNTNPGPRNIVVVPPGEGGVAAAVGSLNGGVQTSPPQAGTLVHMLSVTEALSFSSVAPPVGTATGVGAVPLNGQVSGDLIASAVASASTSTAAQSSPTGSTDGGPSLTGTSSAAASSTSAASSLGAPAKSLGVTEVLLGWTACLVLGFSLGL